MAFDVLALFMDHDLLDDPDHKVRIMRLHFKIFSLEIVKKSLAPEDDLRSGDLSSGCDILRILNRLVQKALSLQEMPGPLRASTSSRSARSR